MHYVLLTIFPLSFNYVYEINLLFFLKLYYIFDPYVFMKFELRTSFSKSNVKGKEFKNHWILEIEGYKFQNL